ncbi:MAG: putative 2-aminoethylphosphonate ABC transporter ATP-binding protein [Alphaproteobacteria bacterium]
MARTPYLRVIDVTKRYGTFEALRHVSLDVAEGEFVCFLGPSGCGKTTLLRAIAGLDVQTSGRIEQGGRDISSLPVSQRDFGIVFQSYALFPNLTVAANIAYGLSARRMGREAIDRRVAELLAMVGLPDSGAKFPGQLSGGQQQRVALARALAPSPGLLLLDEPLSALDARVRLHLRQQIKDLQRRLGVTTIMVTHDQEEALTMADRIAVMSQGTVEQIGTPHEIYQRPSSRFVADFVGTMNVIEAELTTGGLARAGTLELRCAVNGVSGGPAAVCFRPEDIVVRNAASHEANVVDARLDDLEFLGSHYQARLAIGAGALPVLAEFSTNAVVDLGLRPGQAITIALPPARLRVFPRAQR